MKRQFPIFKNHPNLVYLDNAASTQLPQVVIDRLTHYVEFEHANIHRGLYRLSNQTTANFEAVRNIVKHFLEADDSYQTCFTSGATHGLNLVAHGMVKLIDHQKKILISRDSHHSNIVPWQQLAKYKQLKLEYIALNQDGTINLPELSKQIPNAAVIALSHVSNVTGVIHPISKVCQIARDHHCLSIIDGAQALHHFPVSLTQLACDVYVGSAHKVYGPTGAGFVTAKQTLLEKLQPLLFGGSMVDTVSEYDATWTTIPNRFEAGTPPIAQVIGMGESLRWLEQQDRVAIWQNERKLIDYTLKQLASIKGIKVIGPQTNEQRAGIISLTFNNIHPHDVAQILSDSDIAVRAGHHCSQLIHQFFGTNASLRLSLAVYTDQVDIDRFITVLKEAITKLK